MRTFGRLLLVATIASVMAVIGLEMIALRLGHHVNSTMLIWVVPRSVLIWVFFSFLLRGRPLRVGVYVGLLSPFLGALVFFYPWALADLAVVFGNLLICLLVGAVTGAIISFVSRDRRLSSNGVA